VTANNVSTGGDFNATIFNFSGGTISGNATINVSAANIVANSLFANVSSGTIGGNATINVSAANIVANDSLDVEVDSGTIGGHAAVEMNVSGLATVTNDATVGIFGNDPAAFSGTSWPMALALARAPALDLPTKR